MFEYVFALCASIWRLKSGSADVVSICITVCVLFVQLFIWYLCAFIGVDCLQTRNSKKRINRRNKNRQYNNDYSFTKLESRGHTSTTTKLDEAIVLHMC